MLPHQKTIQTESNVHDYITSLYGGRIVVSAGCGARGRRTMRRRSAAGLNMHLYLRGELLV